MPALATRTVQCRHGVFTYYSEDVLVGASLRLYGEYSEDEVLMYDVFLKSTDVAIEVGANIGTLTIPLSRRCKKVFTFEPQPQNYTLLCRNLNTNGITNVDAFPYAIGVKKDLVHMPTLREHDISYGNIGYYGSASVGSGSLLIEQWAIDDIKAIDAKQINFIKMDCEGAELEVLIGAEKLITRDWPLFYIENDKPEKSKALIKWLVDHGYHCYWHRPMFYRIDNFRNYIDNIFGNNGSTNMICLKGEIHEAAWSDWLKEKVV